LSCQTEKPHTERNWSSPNNGFQIRLQVFPRFNGWDYEFESKRRDSEEWNTALVFLYDGFHEMSQDQIKFVDQNTAYIFLGWKIAVTSDAGKSWAEWDGEKDLDGWTCCNYSLIRSVDLDRSGNGRMKLDFYLDEKKKDFLILQTSNYGKNWRKEY